VTVGAAAVGGAICWIDVLDIWTGAGRKVLPSATISLGLLAGTITVSVCMILASVFAAKMSDEDFSKWLNEAEYRDLP